MTDEKRDSVLAAIMRKIGELATSIDRNTAALERFAKMDVSAIEFKKPEQQILPGLPDEDWMPPDVESIPPPPPERRRVTKLYDALWAKYAGEPFSLTHLVLDHEPWEGIFAIGSLNKALSVIRKAGCAKPRRVGGSRGESGVYELLEPTDALRDALDAYDAEHSHSRKEASA